MAVLDNIHILIVDGAPKILTDTSLEAAKRERDELQQRHSAALVQVFRLEVQFVAVELH